MVFYGIGGSSVAYNGGIVRARSFEPYTLRIYNSYVNPMSGYVRNDDDEVISSFVVNPSQYSAITLPSYTNVTYDIAKEADYKRPRVQVNYPASSWEYHEESGLHGVIRSPAGDTGSPVFLSKWESSVGYIYSAVNSAWHVQRISQYKSATALNTLRVLPISGSSFDGIVGPYFRSAYFMFKREGTAPWLPQYANLPLMGKFDVTSRFSANIIKTSLRCKMYEKLESSRYSSFYYIPDEYWGTVPSAGSSYKEVYPSSSPTSITMRSNYSGEPWPSDYPPTESSIMADARLSAQCYTIDGTTFNSSEDMTLGDVEWQLTVWSLK